MLQEQDPEGQKEGDNASGLATFSIPESIVYNIQPFIGHTDSSMSESALQQWMAQIDLLFAELDATILGHVNSDSSHFG